MKVKSLLLTALVTAAVLLSLETGKEMIDDYEIGTTFYSR
jgi:hypothetical protein